MKKRQRKKNAKKYSDIWVLHRNLLNLASARFYKTAGIINSDCEEFVGCKSGIAMLLTANELEEEKQVEEN